MRRVFVCNDFEGYYPVGTAAVVLADSEGEAAVYLRNALKARGLKAPTFTLRELTAYGVEILCDGNY